MQLINGRNRNVNSKRSHIVCINSNSVHNLSKILKPFFIIGAAEFFGGFSAPYYGKGAVIRSYLLTKFSEE